jgi:hypothetical protein
MVAVMHHAHYRTMLEINCTNPEAFSFSFPLRCVALHPEHGQQNSLCRSMLYRAAGPRTAVRPFERRGRGRGAAGWPSPSSSLPPPCSLLFPSERRLLATLLKASRKAARLVLCCVSLSVWLRCPCVRALGLPCCACTALALVILSRRRACSMSGGHHHDTGLCYRVVLCYRLQLST